MALVTGAAGIIGPAITKELRTNGWRVIATDRSQECFDLYEKAFGEAVDADEIVAADLGSQDSCTTLIREIEFNHGRLSAIVNGAAFNTVLPLSAITEMEMRRLFAVNFMAPIFLAQAALPSLIKNRGAIINLSSVLVDEPRPGGLLYACSKASLEKATQIMALELIKNGVRVNNIRIGRVPGYAFLRNTIKELSADLAQQMVRELLAERIEEMERKCGAQGVGRPEDIAKTISFLLSPAARFINGQTLVLDGGFCADSTPAKTIPFDQKIAEWLERHATQIEELCELSK